MSKRTMFNKTVVFIIGFIIVTVFGVPVFGAAGIIGGIFVGAFICIQGRLTHNYTWDGWLEKSVNYK